MHEDLWTIRLMVIMVTMDLHWFKTPRPSFLTFDSNKPVSFCSLTSVQIKFYVWGNDSNNLIITRKCYHFVSMRWIHLYYSNRMCRVSPTVAVFTPVVRAMILMYITTVGVAYIWSSATLFIFSPKLSSHGSFKWTFKVKAVKAAAETEHIQHIQHMSLADPRGAPGTRPPGGPNSFIFMQFSAKMWKIIAILGLGAPPPLGKILDPPLYVIMNSASLHKGWGTL